MHFISIPPEIWIDILKQLSKQDLKSIRLAHRTFEHLAAEPLFSSLAINFGKKFNDIDRIICDIDPNRRRVILSRLRIKGYKPFRYYPFIRGITLQGRYPRTDTPPVLLHRDLLNFITPVLSQLFDAASNLKNVSLMIDTGFLGTELLCVLFETICAYGHRIDITMSLDFFHSDELEGLHMACMRYLSRLKSLRLYTSNLKAEDLARVIARSPRLEYLDAYDDGFKIDDVIALVPQRSMPKLKELGLELASLPQKLETVRRLKSLDELWVSFRVLNYINEPELAERMWRLFEQESIFLSHICMDFLLVSSGFMDYITPKISPPPLRTLTKLEISLWDEYLAPTIPLQTAQDIENLANKFWGEALPFIIPSLKILKVAFQTDDECDDVFAAATDDDISSLKIEPWTLRGMTKHVDNLHPTCLDFIRLTTAVYSRWQSDTLERFLRLSTTNRTPLFAQIVVYHGNPSNFIVSVECDRWAMEQFTRSLKEFRDVPLRPLTLEIVPLCYVTTKEDRWYIDETHKAGAPRSRYTISKNGWV